MQPLDRSKLTPERIAGLAVALGVVALGAVMLWQTRDIRVTPAYSKVGPRVIPYLVGAGLVLGGIWLAIVVLRERELAAAADSEDADPTLPTDWGTIGILAAALVVYLLLIERAGFVIASALLFWGAAFGMGSRRFLRDPVIAVALAAVVYVVFTRGLDLRLPAGWLEGLE